LPRVGGALSARCRQYHGTATSMSNEPKQEQRRSRRGFDEKMFFACCAREVARIRETP
jgi:hypothetical protein